MNRHWVKRVTAAAAVLSMSMLCMPLESFVPAEQSLTASAEDSDFKWELKYKILKISGTGYMPDWTTSAEIPWYSQRSEILEIIIEDGIKNIGDYSFCGCEKVTSVILPESVTSIGYSAFYNCENLTSVNIPDNVTRIGACAFYYCSKLSNITIPSSVESIDGGAFMGCSNLTSITILNPNCDIYDSTNTFGTGVYVSVNEQQSFQGTIYGYKGSTAEAYARAYNCKFEAIEYVPEETKPKETTAPVQTTTTTTTAATTTTSTTTSTTATTPQPTTSTTTTTSTTVTTSATPTTTTPVTTTPVTPDDKFVWGKDNWNFDNNGLAFGSVNKKYHPYYVSEAVQQQMQKDFGFDNKDMEEVKKQFSFYENTSPDAPAPSWKGSCYGMALSMILAKQGDLDLTHFGGKAVVNENLPSDEIISVINMFQIVQNNSSMLQALRQNAVMEGSGVTSQENYMKALIASLKYEPYPVKLSYRIMMRDENGNISNSMCHAVVAYGVEDANYYSPKTRKTYTKRILVADSNYLSQNAVYDDCCLYYDPEDYSWIVPDWCRGSGMDEMFCYWNSYDPTPKGKIDSIMRYTDAGKQFDLMMNENPPHYMAGMALKTQNDAEPNVTMVENKKDDKTQYANNTAGNGTNVAKYMLADAAENTGETEDYFALWNPLTAYRLTYPKLSSFDLKMDYEDVMYFANAQNVSNALFKPSGEIDLEGSNANYDVTIVTNDAVCVTDWYSVNVQGKKVDFLNYYKDTDGYVLESDNLKNVTVTAHNNRITTGCTFSAPCKSVLIYEIDEKTIGVKADSDGDGTFETPLEVTQTAVTESVSLGDVDGTGVVNILDVIAVNKYIIGVKTLSADQLTAADVDGNGEVNSTDSLLILKYALDMISAFPKK